MDLDAIIRIHPEIVIVDELAHTNVEGSRNEKRWQDVMDLLDEGINVISAVNIQHIESINEEVQGISGIEVKERIPDSVLEEADEVVNIDLTAEELIARLKAGKIYKPDKVALALNNFFKTENILQLRELALKRWLYGWKRKWRMKWWFPVWACGMRSSWRVSAVMRKRHAALSARRHDWQPVIIRRSLPFMYRLPGRVPTALPLRTSGIC